MIYLWIGLGLLMVGGGVYMVHLSDRSIPLVKRLGAIVTTMLGSYLLWFIAAVHIPPTHQISVKIEAELADGLVLSFISNSGRSCRIEKLEVSLINSSGSKIHVNSRFVYYAKTGSDDIGFIFVENPSNYVADKVSLNVTHFCPFGFEVETDIADMSLPSAVLNKPSKPQEPKPQKSKPQEPKI